MSEIRHTGDMDFRYADDANIPVDVWLDQDEDTKMWELRANNYMPRRGALGGEHCYQATCADRAPLEELIKAHILPLYQNALAKLQAMANGKDEHLYYWTPPKE